MQQITIIRQMANEHLADFNRLTLKGVAESAELQTECVLETLAELAHRSGFNELYQQITDRQHKLELHTVLDLIAVGEGANPNDAEYSDDIGFDMSAPMPLDTLMGWKKQLDIRELFYRFYRVARENRKAGYSSTITECDPFVAAHKHLVEGSALYAGFDDCQIMSVECAADIALESRDGEARHD